MDQLGGVFFQVGAGDPECLLATLTARGEKTLGITRAHLEEDAAKLIHFGGEGRRANADSSVVDFNRGGTPLLEIVTEPELHHGSDAAAFLKQLRQTLV